MRLKVDLHTHTAGDPQHRFIKYSARELVDRAASMGYGALAITHHTRVFYDRDLYQSARDKGLVLVPGMEANVKRKHVLVYCDDDKSAIDELNAASMDSKGNLSFEQLASLKDRGLVRLVIGAHPYFMMPYCLGDELVVHQDLFDLVEESWYHTKTRWADALAGFNIFNRNQKAQQVASRLGLPLLASSDAHYLENFGRAYSLIDAERDIESIFKVLQGKKQEKIEPVSPPVSKAEYLAFMPKLIKP